MSLPDRYRVTASIGGGGGGHVLAVEDMFLARQLALKLFKADGDSDEQAFMTEFLFTASVSHPNLTRVFDFGYDSTNIPFFTMELIEGDELCARNSLTDEITFMKVLTQVCSGINLLHHFGYTHNDLKISNIRVNSTSSGPVAKILDFGLARDYDPSRASEMAGTVEYMAPEIFKGREYTVSSDIYALGVVLYRLISGRFPFKEDDPLATISGHIEKEAPSLEPRADFINDRMIETVMKMLSKDPSERPPSVMAIASSIADSVGSQPCEFTDFPAGSFLDTATLQSLRKQRAIRDLSKLDDIPAVTVDDRGLAEAAFDFCKKQIQTEFKNVLVDGSERSRTVVNAADNIPFHLQSMRESDEAGHFVSGIVNLGNCGALPEEIADLPSVEAANIIGESIDHILSGEKTDQRTSEILLRRFSDNLEIARTVVDELQARSAFELVADGLVVDSRILQDLEQSERVNELSWREVRQTSLISKDKLARIAVLGHPFDERIVGHILEDEMDATFLEDSVSDRVLRNDGGNYMFSREALRLSLESSLDDRQRCSLHLRAGEYLSEHGKTETAEQLGWAARHFLDAGDLNRAVELAWKHQRAANGSDVYTDTEKLLRDCEAAFADKEKMDATANARLLMAMGDHYKAVGDFDRALTKYRKITGLAGIDKSLLAEAHKDMGDIHKFKHEFSSGIEALNRALEIYKSLDDQLEVSHTLNNLGNMFWVDSQFDGALEHYTRALEIQEKFGAKKDIASTVTNIASVYAVNREYDKAIEFFKRSVDLKKEIHDEPELARSYNNMAAVYQWKGESGRSLNYLNMALVINRRVGAQKEFLFNLENIAEACMSLGEFRRAEEVSAEGLAMARRMEDLPHKAVFCHMLGELYFFRALYGRSLDYLDKSQDLCRKITDKPFAARVYTSKAKTHLALNSLDSAKQYIDQARAITSPLKLTEEIAALKILSAEIAFVNGGDPSAVLATLDSIDKHLEEEELRTRLCESNLLRLNILSRAGRIPSSALERLDKLSELDQHSTFRSHLYFYYGISSASDRLYNEALSYFEQADVMARAFEQRELLWRINYQAGKAFLSQLEYEEAFVKLRTAGDLLKEIASNIDEPDLIQKYMDAPEKAELIDAVRHLTLKLA